MLDLRVGNLGIRGMMPDRRRPDEVDSVDARGGGGSIGTGATIVGGGGVEGADTDLGIGIVEFKDPFGGSLSGVAGVRLS